MPELTEAQLYDLGNRNGSVSHTEFTALVKAFTKLVERQARRIDKLQKRVKKLERGRRR